MQIFILLQRNNVDDEAMQEDKQEVISNANLYNLCVLHVVYIFYFTFIKLLSAKSTNETFVVP